MRKIALLVLLVCIAIPTGISIAAPITNCVSKYTVLPTDTLRAIAKKTGVTPWDIVLANRAYLKKPNYPVPLGIRLCIPKHTATKSLPDYALDQPVATGRAVWKSGYLTVTIYNFAPGTVFMVKADNKVKLQNLKVVKKVKAERTFKYKDAPTRVCIKDMITDGLLCYPVNIVR